MLSMGKDVASGGSCCQGRFPREGNELKERLIRYRQIKISVTGRQSGRTISIPV
jgi:hypothetical protein